MSIDEIKSRWAGAKLVDVGCGTVEMIPNGSTIDDVRALLAEVDRLAKALGDGAAKVEALKARVRSGFPVPPIWEAIDAVAAGLRRAAGEGGGR